MALKRNAWELRSRVALGGVSFAASGPLLGELVSHRVGVYGYGFSRFLGTLEGLKLLHFYTEFPA